MVLTATADGSRHQSNLDRSVIENWVLRHLATWETRDVSVISSTLHSDVEWMLPTLHGQGHNQVQAALALRLANKPALRLHLRRLLIDPVQLIAAVEWMGRYTQPDETGCHEILGGTVLDFDQDGLIRRWRSYLDPVRRRTLADFDGPLPAEGWSPCLDPGPPPPRLLVEQIIHAYARAWSNHSLAQLQAVIHDEIILQPPWDYVVGRAALEAGARVYFANYTDTQVIPHRLILDPMQPHFGVCEQSFACTNPTTGQRGADHDFAFFEIAQGKLRYWRTYFDTTRSVQVVEKTIGFLNQKAPDPKN